MARDVMILMGANLFRGVQRNSVDISIIDVISPRCFHRHRAVNSNDDISSEKHFENLKTSRGSYCKCNCKC